MNTISTTKLKRLLNPVFTKHDVDRVYLFGSYAKGKATPKSDIDLFVDSQLRGLKFVGLIEDIAHVTKNHDVDVINTTHIDPNSQIAHEIQNSGVLLYER